MSTLSVTNIKHASSASNNIALDSSGKATFSGTVVTPSINNGPLAGFRNAIINGNFDIWQRGTSGTSIAAFSFLADRWKLVHSGATVNASRQAFTVGQTDVPGEPQYFHRVEVTSVAGADNYSLLEQPIEGVRTFAGQQVTLSFYAKANATKNVAVEIQQGFGSGGSPSSAVFIYAGSVTLGTTWAKHTLTFNVTSISGKTLGTNGNDTAYLHFWFDAGSNLNSRTGSLGHQSGTFDIAQVQLEAGPVATPFERRPIGTELALCQRYFEKSYDTQTAVGTITTSGNFGMYCSGASSFFNGIGTTVVFATEKRAITTITTYSPTTGASGKMRDIANLTDINSNVAYNNTRSFFCYGVPAQNTNVNLYFQWTASAEL